MYPTLHLPITKTWASTETPDMAAGTIVVEKGRKFMLVKNIAAAVHVKGAPCWPASVNPGEIGKVADVVGGAQGALGAACSAIPASGWGFMLIEGFVDESEGLVLGDGAIAAADPIKAIADTFDTGIVGTDALFGTALEDDTPAVTMYFKSPNA